MTQEMAEEAEAAGSAPSAFFCYKTTGLEGGNTCFFRGDFLGADLHSRQRLPAVVRNGRLGSLVVP